jgi:hypothetical protein
MIRMALFLIATVAWICLIYTPIGWATVWLAIFAGTPTILLIILWREPQSRGVSPYYEREALSTLDRLDGVGNRKAEDK